jgi:hypothetical protein
MWIGTAVDGCVGINREYLMLNGLGDRNPYQQESGE